MLYSLKKETRHELWTPKTKKLLKSTKHKIPKGENGETVPLLEITEVILLHCNIVKKDHQQDKRVLHTFVK